MAGAIIPEAANIKQDQTAVSKPFISIAAIMAAAVGLLWMLSVIIFGFYGVIWTVPVCIGLLGGFIAALLGLAKRSNYSRLHRRIHSTTLVVLTLMALFLIPGPGVMRLLDLHCRLRVAMTGGQSKLQSWAVDLLAQPRDSLNPWSETGENADQWTVPKSHWSQQVTSLNPKRVFIDKLFEHDHEGVTLMYGGGFLGHWYIVLGPPDAVPSAKLTTERSSPWFHWGNGVFCWVTD